MVSLRLRHCADALLACFLVALPNWSAARCSVGLPLAGLLAQEHDTVTSHKGPGSLCTLQPSVALAPGCPAGRRLDNCLNNTAAVGDSLQVHKVDPQVGVPAVTAASEAEVWRAGMLDGGCITTCPPTTFNQMLLRISSYSLLTFCAPELHVTLLCSHCRCRCCW